MAKKDDFNVSFDEIKDALKSEKEDTKKGEEESGEKINPKNFGSTEEEWNMEDEDDILASLPEAKAEEEEEVEAKKEKTEETEKTEKKVQDEKLKEDLIEYLEESGDTKVTIKGKEHDLRDLSTQEIKDRFSKAGRFYERMEDISKKEKELDRRAQLLEQAVSVQRVPEQERRMPRKENIPDFLKEGFEDTEEVKLLKKSQVTLIGELDVLKAAVGRQGTIVQEDRFFAEVEKYKQEYPCASIDEVMLLKRMRPNIPTEKIMERSHEHYSSEKFVETALEANPELKRTLYEKAVNEHATKGDKSSKIGRRRASSSGSGKITAPRDEGKPKTWAEADKRAKAYLRAVAKAD